MRILSVGIVRASHYSCNNALMRSLVGVGTPRSLQGHLATIVALVIALWTRVERRWRDHHTPSDDQASVFTPNHRFELLPVGASEGDL